MRTKKGGLFSRTAWTKWITSTSMSHAQNGCLVFVLFHQLLLRPERWVMIMSSAWICLFLLKRAVHVKPASPCVKLWPVSSCDNDVTVTPQSPPFCHVIWGCLIYLFQPVSVLCLGRPAPVVGFHFRRGQNLNRESTKLRNIYLLIF